MSINQTTAIAGRIASPAELRFTAAGQAVASFTLASSTRKKNPAGEWEDSPAAFIRVTAWRHLAEHLAESDLRNGDPVLVSGDLELREWEAADGSKRRDLELTARHVAVDLARFPVTPRRVDRQNGPPSGPESPSEPRNGPPARPAALDPGGPA